MLLPSGSPLRRLKVLREGCSTRRFCLPAWASTPACSAQQACRSSGASSRVQRLRPAIATATVDGVRPGNPIQLDRYRAQSRQAPAARRLRADGGAKLPKSAQSRSTSMFMRGLSFRSETRSCSGAGRLGGGKVDGRCGGHGGRIAQSGIRCASLPWPDSFYRSRSAGFQDLHSTRVNAV